MLGAGVGEGPPCRVVLRLSLGLGRKVCSCAGPSLTACEAFLRVRLCLPGHKCVRGLDALTRRGHPHSRVVPKSAKGLCQRWDRSSVAVKPTVSAGARAGHKSWHPWTPITWEVVSVTLGASASRPW